MSPCVSSSGMQVGMHSDLHTSVPDGREVPARPAYRTATHREWHIPDAVKIQLTSWWWARVCSKHVEEWNKRIIYKRIVRQVGHLPEVVSRCTVSKIFLKMMNSVFVCGGYKRSLDGIARERNAGRHVLLWQLASLARCTAQACGFWVDKVRTLQANWRVITPPVFSELLIAASNRNPSCVKPHEKVSGWSIWPRDQQVHRKGLSHCPSWNTSSCWTRQEIPNVVENTEVSVPSCTVHWPTNALFYFKKHIKIYINL